MKLTSLYELQQNLDEKIEANRTCTNKIEKLRMAINIELCEMLNEWKGFKYWSNSKQTNVIEMKCEYADVLHMMLSLGLSMGIVVHEIEPNTKGTIYDKYFNITHILSLSIFDDDYEELKRQRVYYEMMLGLFLGMAHDLEIKDSEIEYHYCLKNLVNIRRIKENY